MTPAFDTLKKPFGILFIFCLAINYGCAPDNEDDAFRIDKYFDLMALANEQLQYYDSNPPSTIQKTFFFQNEKESQSQDLDKLSEIKEILETANINKPGYRGVYEIQKSFETNGFDTNFSVIRNLLKKGESANVQELKAYYNGPPNKDKLSRILIHKKRDNFLYKNTQIILLNFEAGHLRKLMLNGKQSILFFEPERFKMSIKVTP